MFLAYINLALYTMQTESEWESIMGPSKNKFTNRSWGVALHVVGGDYCLICRFKYLNLSEVWAPLTRTNKSKNV